MSSADGAVNGAPGRAGTQFSCGDLRVDVGRQRVLQDGRELALPKLSFEMLLALLRAAPNVSSVDTLIERVWGNVVVSPETAIQRVKLLRDALGDNPQEPRYIGSLRGRGYFMIPAVADEVAAMPAAAVAPARPRPRWLAPLLLASAVAAVAAVLLVAWLRTGADHRAPSSTATASAAAASFTHATASTVAVMPFQNLSSDGADAFLATGLPEMILNQLSAVRNLAVVARSSSFALAPGVGDAREIGRRLNAGYLVEGTVQREGEEMRVTAQLIDTASGTLVWSEKFDRQIHALFAMQDEISSRITAVLAGRVSGLEVSHEPRERSANVPAQLSYLHGLALLGRYTVVESEAAIPLFEKAIADDPGFAAAYAALYDAHMQVAERQVQDLASARARWRPLITKALAVNPQSGAAHFARAMWGGGSARETEADFRLGLKLDPSNGRGIMAFSEFLMDQQDAAAEADLLLQRALWIDPLAPRPRFRRAMASLDALGAAAVEQQVLQVLKIDPNYQPALQRYSKYRWYFHGALAEAIQIIEQAIAIDPRNPWSCYTAMAMYLDLGDEAAARDVAAATPASEQSAQVLLALYRGDWHRAGTEAYAPSAWTSGLFENWGTPEALRDFALRSGDTERAARFMASQYDLDPHGALRLDLGNFRAAAMLADILDAQARTSEAARLRAAAAAWNDANQEKYGTVFAKRLRARLWLLAGQRDAALQELAASFRAGDYVQWWYTLDHDPGWAPVRSDPRFRAIDAQVRAYVARQRAIVDDLRRRGEIPRRDGAGPAPSAAAAAAGQRAAQ